MATRQQRRIPNSNPHAREIQSPTDVEVSGSLPHRR
jgi:hypothetical protein